MNEYWYSVAYAVALLAAYLMARHEDKLTWLVLCSFSVLSVALNAILWDRIDHPLEHLGFASIEAAKILILLRFAGGRLPVYMSALLSVAWLANFGLYLDLKLGTNLVYDQYETLIAAITLGQLIPFFDGLARKARSILDAVVGLRALRIPGRVNFLASVEGSCKDPENYEER